MHKNDKVLVFCQTKRGCEQLFRQLSREGFSVQSIHGDKSQRERDIAMDNFKKSTIQILVATDVASRGLDISDITLVVNFDFPKQIEDYIHRIGRTGRAGAYGTAVSFLTADEDKKIGRDLIEVMEEAGQEIPQDLVEMVGSGGGFKQKRNYYNNNNNYNNNNYNSHYNRFGPNNNSLMGNNGNGQFNNNGAGNMNNGFSNLIQMQQQSNPLQQQYSHLAISGTVAEQYNKGALIKSSSDQSGKDPNSSGKRQGTTPSGFGQFPGSSGHQLQDSTTAKYNYQQNGGGQQGAKDITSSKFGQAAQNAAQQVQITPNKQATSSNNNSNNNNSNLPPYSIYNLPLMNNNNNNLNQSKSNSSTSQINPSLQQLMNTYGINQQQYNLPYQQQMQGAQIPYNYQNGSSSNTTSQSTSSANTNMLSKISSAPQSGFTNNQYGYASGSAQAQPPQYPPNVQTGNANSAQLNSAQQQAAYQAMLLVQQQQLNKANLQATSSMATGNQSSTTQPQQQRPQVEEQLKKERKRSIEKTPTRAANKSENFDAVSYNYDY